MPGLPSRPLDPLNPRLWGAGGAGARGGREQAETLGRGDRQRRTGRGGQNRRGAVTRRAESVPGGAGDEEAHVVQGPPGAGLGPRPLRTLGRRGLGLGLRRPRGALAAAQLSAHGLQEEKPVRCSASPTAPSPPLRPSPRAAGAAGPENRSAGLHVPLARAAAPGGAIAVTSPPGLQSRFWPRGRDQARPHPPATGQSRLNLRARAPRSQTNGRPAPATEEPRRGGCPGPRAARPATSN